MSPDKSSITEQMAESAVKLVYDLDAEGYSYIETMAILGAARELAGPHYDHPPVPPRADASPLPSKREKLPVSGPEGEEGDG